MGFGLGDAFGLIANPGQFWGTNDLIGGALNDITGATNSSKRQFKNQLTLQHDAQNFAKWQMQNAHQTEVQDLQDAGLNPVLSANGGASAGVSMGSASTGTASADPIGMISAIVSMMNSTKTTKALVEKTDAETGNIKQDTINKGQEYTLKPGIVKAATDLQKAQTSKTMAEKEKILADKLAQDFSNRMREMDVDKRSSEFLREKMIYQKQMQRALTLAGYGNEHWDLVWSKFGERVKQLSPLADWQPHMNSSSYNYSPVSVNY